MTSFILMSGGLDSTTLLFDRLQAGEKMEAVFVDYGQRMAETEERATRALTTWANVPLHVLRTPLPRNCVSGWLVDSPDTVEWSDHKVTNLPHRNLYLLTLAAMLATHRQVSTIYLGFMDIQADPFPDSTEEFVSAAEQVLRLSDSGITVAAPFIHKTKRDIAVRALSLGVPIDYTFSCTFATDHHCRQCPSCLDRFDALSYARTLANSQVKNANT